MRVTPRTTAGTIAAVERTRPGDNEVHLWWANCETAPTDLNSLLPEEERARAARFRAPAARRRFVAARTLTRMVLARYTGSQPAELRFRTGARGKPRLDGPADQPPSFHFNAAHSGNTAVVAVAASEVGVDVESLRRVPNLTRLASRFCSDFEREHLCALPDPQREEAFLTIWTCKEAYLKAVGSGIAMPLKQVEVALDLPRLVRISGDPHAAAEWTLLHHTLPEPATCTAAVRSHSARLCVHRFTWPQDSTPLDPAWSLG